jgi:tetratricopeptide (TPR) repeat protein
MYLRTPKRYQKQRRHLFSLRWLWLWLLTPLVVTAGYFLYENRAEFAPVIERALGEVASDAQRNLATVTAPTPLPTVNPTDRLVVADDAWAQGSIDEALRTYEEILPSVPNDVLVHYRVTLALLMDGRVNDAVEAAERTLTANPFSPDAWAIRSQALNAAGRYGEAIASALQAINLLPPNPDTPAESRGLARATAFLAEAYFDSNQPQRALETAGRALEIDPESFEANYVYARIQQESTFDFEEAQRAFQTAYDLAPNMPYIGVQMAWALYGQQEYDAGFEILQNIAELNPENTNALYALGRFAYGAYGDPNQALDYLNRCVTIAPESILCNNYLGTVYFGLGQNTEAARYFEEAVELGTVNPRHYLSAANINITLGNCPKALPYLEEGYRMEQARLSPNVDNLVGFEEGLRACGADFTAIYTDDESTPEAAAPPEATAAP